MFSTERRVSLCHFLEVFLRALREGDGWCSREAELAWAWPQEPRIFVVVTIYLALRVNSPAMGWLEVGSARHKLYLCTENDAFSLDLR